MPDVTGAPVPTGSSPFDVPGDLGKLADHFGDGFSVATASGLPSSGNWVGRSMWVVDEALIYVWNGSAWSGEGSVIAPTAATGWSFSGGFAVSKVGTSKRTDASVQITRSGGTLSISTSGYTTVGTIIPAAARVAGSPVRYPDTVVWSGSPGNVFVPAKLAVDPASGLVQLRAVGSGFSLYTNGFFELMAPLF